MPNKYLVNQRPYQIKSIDACEPPKGAEGANWFHYVITQGENTINGYRQGNLNSVIRAVEENVQLLNERQIGKRGRVQLVPTQKNTN